MEKGDVARRYAQSLDGYRVQGARGQRGDAQIRQRGAVTRGAHIPCEVMVPQEGAEIRCAHLRRFSCRREVRGAGRVVRRQILGARCGGRVIREACGRARLHSGHYHTAGRAEAHRRYVPLAVHTHPQPGTRLETELVDGSPIDATAGQSLWRARPRGIGERPRRRGQCSCQRAERRRDRAWRRPR